MKKSRHGPQRISILHLSAVVPWVLLLLCLAIHLPTTTCSSYGGPPSTSSWHSTPYHAGDTGAGADDNDDTNDPNYDYRYSYPQQQQPGDQEEYPYESSSSTASSWSTQRSRPPPPQPPGSRRSNLDTTTTTTSGDYYPHDPYYSDSSQPSQSWQSDAPGDEQQYQPSHPHQQQWQGRSSDPYNNADYSQASSPPPPRRPATTDGASTRPPPPPSTTAPRIPIHYEFPIKVDTATTDDDDNKKEGSEDGIPITSSSMDVDTTSSSSSSILPKASPRKDLITRYMSTTSGKLQVYASSSVVGASTGIFLAKTMLPFGTLFWASICGFGCTLSSMILRTPLGELTRAVALSLVLVAQRTQSIRRRYPTWRYVPGALFLSSNNNNNGNRNDRRYGPPRRRPPPPFPPSRNPWTYTPQRSTDVEFNMMYSMIAMAMVGSTCGGNLPMIPTWMGSLAGAALFALGCTLTNSPRGDLCRTMGMRVVALVQELWDIQAQLRIVPKAAIVSSQIIDRLMILDRQHRVKDRFLQLVNAGYEQAMKTASRVQEQRLEEQGRTSRNGNSSRPYAEEDNQRRPPQPFRSRENVDDDYDRRRRPPPRRRGPRNEMEEDEEYRASGRYRDSIREKDERGRPRSPLDRDDGDDVSSSSSRWDRRTNRDDDSKADKDIRQGDKPTSRGWFGGRR